MDGLKGESEFYQLLTRDERQYLFNGNVMQVGGRDVDITQLALSIQGEVRDFYPINRVPVDLVASLEALKEHARAFERTFDGILRVMIQDVIKRRDKK